MEVMVQLPDEIVKHLGQQVADMPRQLLEVFAIGGYRSERLSRHQVSELLGLNYWQTEVFLTKHNAKPPYSLADLDVDRASFAKIPKK